jgi:hypothetical protein
MRTIFLDTSGILALVNKSDSLHEKAISVNQMLLLEKIRFITTDYVLVEVANALSKYKFLGIKAIDLLRNSVDIKIIKIDDNIFEESIKIYQDYLDKTWGLTDITSFMIMKKIGITEAFTHDSHFTQFGFNILLD